MKPRLKIIVGACRIAGAPAVLSRSMSARKTGFVPCAEFPDAAVSAPAVPELKAA